MEYKTLVQKLETLEHNLSDDKSAFICVLHNLYLKDNSKAMKELTESFARYLLKTRKDCFEEEGYTGAFLTAMEGLDEYSEEADKKHSLKIFKDEAGPIQDFYRDSVNYFQQETLSRSN